MVSGGPHFSCRALVAPCPCIWTHFVRTVTMAAGTPNGRMSDLEPGTVLQNTYQVVRPIGRGAMGQVYEVAHARLSGRYALKLLTNEAAADAEFLQRFKREAQIVSGLRHPHIVQVIDFDQNSDGRPYLVMELLDGEDLAARIGREGPLALSRVVTIIGQIASALQTAHELGVIHRDLKPENVLLMHAGTDRGDFAKLVDFGISKVKNATLRLTQERMMIGTPHYMSPEQARSGDVDERADQFALAAIAYELLSGELAFAGDNVPAVVYQVVHGQPPRLADGGWISPAVDEVLLKGMAKRPQDRYATVTEFASAFAAAARGLDEGAALCKPRPAAATTRRNRRSQMDLPTRRLRLGRRTIVALAVAGVAVAGTIWTLTRSPDGPAISERRPATVRPKQEPEPLPERVAPAPLPEPATVIEPPPPAPKATRKPPARRPGAQAKDRLYNEL
jgi:serine/threonine protein kinase